MSGNISKVWVNDSQAQTLFNFFKNDPCVQMCRAKIMSTLLSGGLEVTRKGQKPSKDFEWVIHKFWLPFLSDLVDAFYAFGFAIWSVKEIEVALPSKRGLRLGKNKKGIMPTQKLRVPYIRPYGSWKLQIHYNTDAYVTYHMYNVSQNVMSSSFKEDPSMKILLTNEYRPTFLGYIRSPIVPLMPGFQFCEKMKELALHTEHIRSYPPLICEARPNNVTNTDAVAIEMFGDCDTYETEEEASYSKNKLRMAQFQRNVNMASAMNGKRPVDVTKEIDPYTGRIKKKLKQKHVWENSVFVIPEGMTMSRPVQTEARNDLLDFIDKQNDMVCSVMGVPKTLLLDIDQAGKGIGGTSGGTMDLTYRLYMRAIESLAQKMQPFMEEVYFEVYGESASFSFPFLPMIETDELIKLGELGIVSRETYGKHLLAAVGLPKSELQLQEETIVKKMTLPEHAKNESNNLDGGKK